MDRYEKIKKVSFIGEEDFNKLRDARVLILGAGAVGTNLVLNLVSMGISHIGIVDNDIIEKRNLSIQPLYNEKVIGCYKVDIIEHWVSEYNPYVDFKTYKLRLNESNYKEIFENYDFLVDAFDTQKSVLLENKLAIKTNKPIVFTGTKDMECFIFTVIPRKTPCFNCFLEHNKIYPDKPYGVFQATGSIAASLQTMEIIKLILNKGKINHTYPLLFDGFSCNYMRPKIYKSKIKKCNICGLPMISYRMFNE